MSDDFNYIDGFGVDIEPLILDISKREDINYDFAEHISEVLWSNGLQNKNLEFYAGSHGVFIYAPSILPVSDLNPTKPFIWKKDELIRAITKEAEHLLFPEYLNAYARVDHFVERNAGRILKELY